MTTAAKSPVPNAFSVDVEDYFHAEALAGCVRREDWDRLESRVARNTHLVLELLARYNVRATFFVLGWVAEKFPGLVREIAAAGHELACHSFYHRLIYKLSPAEFRDDTRRAKAAIEDAAGVPVFGYRAPTFSITARSLWALDILAEEGFRYDSSIFPTRHDLYGMPDFSRFACGPGASLPLAEFPMSTFRWLGRNWPFAGGGYLRILPLAYTLHGFRSVNQGEGKPVIVYVHPWEFDPEQPRFAAAARSRFRHYTNLAGMKQRVESLLARYTFVPVGALGAAASPAELAQAQAARAQGSVAS
jgi:polysaccharide deacetylase family protein (PEP-CTERM system associated)